MVVRAQNRIVEITSGGVLGPKVEVQDSPVSNHHCNTPLAQSRYFSTF